MAISLDNHSCRFVSGNVSRLEKVSSLINQMADCRVSGCIRNTIFHPSRRAQWFPYPLAKGVVINGLLSLTNGQPYLIQLIGRALVSRYNRQVFEKDQPREKRFNFADLEAVVNSLDFYLEGNAYFAGVWRQAETTHPLGQTDILFKLCRNPLPPAQIVEESPFNLAETEAILQTLQRHDVIHMVNTDYAYTVELMRRWVEKTKLNKNS